MPSFVSVMIFNTIDKLALISSFYIGVGSDL